MCENVIECKNIRVAPSVRDLLICLKLDKNKLGEETREGGLPGGPMDVLTVYPQHSTVVAAPVTLKYPPEAHLHLFLSCLLSSGLSLSPSSFQPHTDFILTYSSHKFLSSLPPSSSRFKQETAKES